MNALPSLVRQWTSRALGWILVWAIAAMATLPLAPASCQESNPQKPADSPTGGQLPIKPPPVPTGVIPLPQGSPPTTIQAPVPSPARLLPKAGEPLRESPDISAVPGFSESREITIQDAVSIALYTSRPFAQSVAQLQQSRGRTGQARSALRPQAGVNADLTYFDEATTADLSSFSGGGSSSGSGGSAPAFVITPQFNPTITSALTLPIDVAGTLRSAVSQAQFTEVAARIDVNRVRNQIVFDTKSAFYNALRAQAQLAVATDNVNNALNRLEDANKNYAAGTAPRFDVISAQRDVAVAQQGQIDARAQVSVAMAGLKSTIGVAITSRFRITDRDAIEYPPGALPPSVPPIGPNGQPLTTPPVTGATAPESKTPAAPVETASPASPAGSFPPPQIPPSTSSVEDPFEFGPEFTTLLQEARKNRPEALEGDAQVAAASHGVQYARRSSLPSLSLSLTDTYSPNAAGFTRRNVGAATLGISIPILDGGLARARVDEARGAAASAEVNRRTAYDQIQVDVQQAYIALVQARNRVAVANVGLAQAREAYRLARVRYNAGVSQQQGVSPQLELSNAQTTLAQAQSNQVNALFDYNSSRAQLDRATGRYSFTGGQPGYPAPPSPAVRGARK